MSFMREGNGDSYRWTAWSEPSFERHTIDIIEPPDGTKRRKRKGQKVPFGFARAFVDRVEPAEPLLWEGED